jgi:hypothetical protein
MFGTVCTPSDLFLQCRKKKTEWYDFKNVFSQKYTKSFVKNLKIGTSDRSVSQWRGSERLGI